MLTVEELQLSLCTGSFPEAQSNIICMKALCWRFKLTDVTKCCFLSWDALPGLSCRRLLVFVSLCALCWVQIGSLAWISRVAFAIYFWVWSAVGWILQLASITCINISSDLLLSVPVKSFHMQDRLSESAPDLWSRKNEATGLLAANYPVTARPPGTVDKNVCKKCNTFVKLLNQSWSLLFSHRLFDLDPTVLVSVSTNL